MTVSMKKLSPIALCLGALLVVAFALLYGEADWLWKVQQHNLFLGSSLFFRQQMVVPGGMLSYLGAFFTQHFFYPWVGVVLLCAWWLLLMWLTRQAFRIPGRWIVLPMVPVAFLLMADVQLGYWVYVIKQPGFFFVPTIGVSAAMAMLWAFRSLRRAWPVQSAAILLAALAGYPLFGVYALAAVLLMGVVRWRLSPVALLSAALVPLLYYRFVYYETRLGDIYTAALPQFTVSDTYPAFYLPYAMLAAFCLLMAILRDRLPAALRSRLQSSRVRWAVQGVVLALAVAVVCRFWYRDANFHHELRMQRCIEQADWEGVIREGRMQQGEPTRSIVVMHNLALSRLGRQCDEMYRFPRGSRKAATPLPVYMCHVAGRMMLYHYGIINECHRLSMEEGVEYGWTAELLCYMARCAIFSGEHQAARKFLDILRQTWYYGSWADRMERLMNDRQQLARDPETGPVLRMMHYRDHLDAVEGWVERCVMTTLAQTDADDLYFQEQAVLGAMWTREPAWFWPRLEHYYHLCGNRPLPRIFQEAAWLFANLEGQEGLDEWQLEPGVRESFSGFMKLMQQYRQQPRNPLLRQYLYDQYGQTYYFEYFFLRDITYY